MRQFYSLLILFCGFVTHIQAQSPLCPSSPTSFCCEYISEVNINGNITTGDTGFSGPGYFDYTANSVGTLTAGNTFPVSVTVKTNSTYQEFVKIWFDFNGNGNLADAGELVFDQPDTFNGTHVYSGNIMVPLNAYNGNVYIRVVMTYANSPTLCGSYAYGNTIDYKATITGGMTSENLTVSTTTTGGATGKIVSSPAGIDTSNGFNSSNFAINQSIILTATPTGGASTFLGWSGDATGSTNPLTVTMNSAKNIVANFGPPVSGSENLTVSTTGTGGAIGMVVSSPAGIDTSKGLNSSNFAVNQNVVLTATPTGGNSTFIGWSGDATGSVNPLTVTMNSAKNIVANFGPPVSGSENLTVSTTGMGGATGMVVSSPAGIDTSKGLNSSNFAVNQNVVLTATPTGGNSTFIGWSGDVTGSVNPLTVTMNAAKNIVANFGPNATAPSNLSYGGNLELPVGVTMTTVIPSVNGSQTLTFSVSSTLPTGLIFDTSTGAISGTPTVLVNATEFTVTATNNLGSTTTTFTIHIFDNINPTITAPSAVTVSTDAGCTATGVTLGTPVTGDNYKVTSVTNDAPTVFPLGNTNVTWTVTDSSGNTATAIQAVTVKDTTFPVIVITNTSVALDANGQANITLDKLYSSITDNCTVASINASKLTYNCDDLGTTTVELTATDGSGNVTKANVTVTVTVTFGNICDKVNLYVAEAVTPNGDGINDTWVIYNIENHPGTVVRVFNRWGSEVFYSNNYKNDWNGSYQNKDTLPESSSYFYEIDLGGDGSIDNRGWLYITR